MIKELLKSLKFSEKEAKVYLALLELGSAKAHDIARKTGINRTTVYDLLEILLHRGLISKYKKGALAYFNARDPKYLLSYLDREKEEQEKNIDKQKKKLEFVNTKTPFEKKQSSFSSKRKIYASHYDDETIKIVNEIYKCDFLLFNYKMVNNFADLEKNFIKNY